MMKCFRKYMDDTDPCGTTCAYHGMLCDAHDWINNCSMWKYCGWYYLDHFVVVLYVTKIKIYVKITKFKTNEIILFLVYHNSKSYWHIIFFQSKRTYSQIQNEKELLYDLWNWKRSVSFVSIDFFLIPKVGLQPKWSKNSIVVNS